LNRYFSSVVKLASLVVALTFAMALLPGTSAAAATACSVSKWNVNIGTSRNPIWVSGGCTCYVAEKIGKNIPWRGDAGDWYRNSTWSKNTDEPRANAIAAFTGHVAWIDSVRLINSKDTNVRQQTVQTGTLDYLTWKTWYFVWVTEPVYLTITTKTVVETYEVNVSQRDYLRSLAGNNSIRYTNWTATRTYEVRNGSAGPATWNTPRQGNAGRLQGYIYPEPVH
jgi:hypothetical protein